MKDILNKSAMLTICSSILAIIMGLIMIIKPDISLTTIGVIISVYIIIYGVLLVALDFKAIKYNMPTDGLIPGILCVVIGAILLFRPDIVSSALGIALGVFIILSSINSIRIAIAIKAKNSPWILLLILGIFSLIVGVIVIFNPFGSMLSLTICMGIMIIIYSVLNIVDMIILKKNVDKISKIIEDNLKERLKEIQ